MADYNILAQGLIGAVAGGAQSVVHDMDREQKQKDELEIERRREEMVLRRAEILSKLRGQEYAANARTDIENIPARGAAETGVAAERQSALAPGQREMSQYESDLAVSRRLREPRTLSPGSSEVVDGKITVTAPQKAMEPEQRDLLRAQVARVNAETKAIEDGLRWRAPSAGKEALPKLAMKELDGRPVMVDEHSGAYATFTDAELPRKGESRWFGPDDPDTPGKPAQPVWRDASGSLLAGGLPDLYPAMRKRIGERGAATPYVALAATATPSSATPGEPSRGRGIIASAKESEDGPPTPAEHIGRQVDAAREEYAALETPPPGRNADALAAWRVKRDALLAKIGSLSQQYEAAIGPIGAYYGPGKVPLRKKPSGKPWESYQRKTDEDPRPAAPKSKVAYDALSPGALYVHPKDGKIYRKPGGESDDNSGR